MAKTSTNDRKRQDMALIMATVLGEKGWKPTDLAAVMGVTGSAISQWKFGKSMGTNAQRAKLGTLPARTSPEARDLMEKVVIGARGNVRHAQERLAGAEGAYDALVQEQRETKAFEIEHHGKRLEEAHAKARAAVQPSARDAYYVTQKSYTNAAGEGISNYEWDKEYHTKAKVDAETRTEEKMAELAKERQENMVAYDKKLLAKEQAYLAKMEKILAKW